jgi:hypothetical protein
LIIARRAALVRLRHFTEAVMLMPVAQNKEARQEGALAGPRERKSAVAGIFAAASPKPPTRPRPSFARDNFLVAKMQFVESAVHISQEEIKPRKRR